MKPLKELSLATALCVATSLTVTIASAQNMPEGKSEIPILVVDIAGGELSLRAYSRTGDELFDAGRLFAPSWAPDGTRFVAFKRIDRSNVPIIVGLDGKQVPLFPRPLDANFLYRPIWSPNGDKIALIRYSKNGFGIIVVDPRTGGITSEVEFSRELTAGFPFSEAAYDRFAWSPDGEKIILSWGGVLVFDTQTGRAEIASKNRALAFWAPGSDAVCMVTFVRNFPDPFSFRGLQRFELETSATTEIATVEELKAAGIDRARWLLVGRTALSPDGRRVAVSMGDLDHDTDAIRIYEASSECIADLNAPSLVIPTVLVAVMDWSPNGDALAVIEAGETRWEARVIDIETVKRVKLNALEIDGETVDVLGFLGMLSWSR